MPVLLKCHVFRDIQYKGRFPHGRPGRHEDQFGILESGRFIIQIRKPGRQSCYIAPCFGRLFNGMKSLQYDLPDRYELTCIAGLKQSKQLFLGLVQNLVCRFISQIAGVSHFFCQMDQPSKNSLFRYNIGIMPDVGRRRYGCQQIPYIFHIRDLRRNILFSETILQRDQIDFAAFRKELCHRIENNPVLLLIEIIGSQNLRSRLNCRPVHQHGTDHGLFRFFTVRQYAFDHRLVHVFSLSFTLPLRSLSAGPLPADAV